MLSSEVSSWSRTRRSRTSHATLPAMPGRGAARSGAVSADGAEVSIGYPVLDPLGEPTLEGVDREPVDVAAPRARVRRHAEHTLDAGGESLCGLLVHEGARHAIDDGV